jgi:hypothetical protein
VPSATTLLSANSGAAGIQNAAMFMRPTGSPMNAAKDSGGLAAPCRMNRYRLVVDSDEVEVQQLSAHQRDSSHAWLYRREIGRLPGQSAPVIASGHPIAGIAMASFFHASIHTN